MLFVFLEIPNLFDVPSYNIGHRVLFAGI
jgi:hypothetical protein